MESNTFYDIYLEELKNLPQGTPEEETALLKKLTEGDKTAASRLTELKPAQVRGGRRAQHRAAHGWFQGGSGQVHRARGHRREGARGDRGCAADSEPRDEDRGGDGGAC